MAMSDHWEWALRRALADTSVTHVAFLTDRMLFQPGGLQAIVTAMQRWPTRVITFALDRISDHERPVRLEQAAWSGRVLRISSDLFIRDWSHARQETGGAVPKLLNSVVPRAAVERIQGRFGTACGAATSPDFAFAFRCIAVIGSVHYFDRPVLIHYALDRSNGASAERGEVTPDHADFMTELSGRGILADAPLPGIVSVFNSIMQEYCAVRSHAGWPMVEMVSYLDALEREVSAMEASPRREHALKTIAEHRRGTTQPEARQPARYAPPRLARSPTYLARRALHRLQLAINALSGDQRFLPSPLFTLCPSREAAIALSRASPRKPHNLLSWLELHLGYDARPPAVVKVGSVRT
jgi:hypothetical protein